jgi:hypothetical protein
MDPPEHSSAPVARHFSHQTIRLQAIHLQRNTLNKLVSQPLAVFEIVNHCPQTDSSRPSLHRGIKLITVRAASARFIGLPTSCAAKENRWELFRPAKAAGLSTSLDTNDEPENKWDRDLLEVLQYVDIFLPNDREAKKIARTDDLSQAINRSQDWLRL